MSRRFVIAELCGGPRDGERQIINWTGPDQIITVAIPLELDLKPLDPLVPAKIVTIEYEMAEEQYIYTVGSRTYPIAMIDAGASLHHPKWTVTRFHYKREA